MRAFDAIVGLLGQASLENGNRAAIGREIRSALESRTASSTEEQAALEGLRRSVECVLERPREAEEKVIARGRRGLVRKAPLGTGRRSARDAALQRAVDDDSDGAETDADGMFPAILSISSLVQAPASIFFVDSPQGAKAAWSPERTLAALNLTEASADSAHARSVN